MLSPVISNRSSTLRVLAGHLSTRMCSVRPWVGPRSTATSRHDLPSSLLAVTTMRSFVLRARNCALKPSPTRSPGTSTGTVIVPVPPFHQQASPRTSTLSNTTPIVAVVSFLSNAGSVVIRHAIDRVAIAGSRSAATVIVFFPASSHGMRSRRMLKIVFDFDRLECRVLQKLDPKPVRIAPEDLDP